MCIEQPINKNENREKFMLIAFNYFERNIFLTFSL